MHWAGQTNRWQTNDRGHSGSGEAWGGDIHYLEDYLTSDGDCELAITRCRVAWGKINELLPVLTSRSFTITSRGIVYNLCVRSAMFHASETWAPTISDSQCLQRNDWARIRWMCGVTTKDQVSSQELLERIAAWRSGKGTPHPLTQMAWPCRNMAMVVWRNSRNSIQ